MKLPPSFKRVILGAVERAGYVVLNQQAFSQLQDTVGSLRNSVASLADQNGRLGEEIQGLNLKLANLTDENERLGQEVRGLNFKLQDKPPAIDYQVLMDHQAKQRKFELTDPDFFVLYERVKPYTMTSIERLYAMHQAVKHVATAAVQGAIVECGVWRGGSMMMAALTLLALGKADRDLFLFDTFAGHPRPDPERDGKDNYDVWLQRRRTDRSSFWADVTLTEVRANLAATDYPLEKLRFIQGVVQETIPGNAPDAIALLRLDTDWYESTAHELQHLYPRLVAGGVLIVDDYGDMKGQKQAVDEFCERNEVALLLNRIDYSGRIAVKMP